MSDLYTNYLMVADGLTTATEFSSITNGEYSHDQLTTLLAEGEVFNPKTLWKSVKPFVRKFQNEEDGILTFDDTIVDKEYTDENGFVSKFYDHSKNKYVNGVNILTAYYSANGFSCPVGVSFMEKEKDKNGNYKQIKTKNEELREMVVRAVYNEIPFSYVLADSWYATKENMEFIKKKLNKNFIFSCQNNRLFANSELDLANGNFVNIKDVTIKNGESKKGFLKGIPFPILLIRFDYPSSKEHVGGIVYLVTSDLELSNKNTTTIYRKRWKVEEYHKSLKQNASLGKMPAKTKMTQQSSLCASLIAFVKFECLRISGKLNHFAMKQRIRIEKIKTGMAELKKMKKGISVPDLCFA